MRPGFGLPGFHQDLFAQRSGREQLSLLVQTLRFICKKFFEALKFFEAPNMCETATLLHALLHRGRRERDRASHNLRVERMRSNNVRGRPVVPNNRPARLGLKPGAAAHK